MYNQSPCVNHSQGIKLVFNTNSTLPSLDCDGEYGYDSARACQKMEVRKTIDGGYESTASFCFATDSTCSNKQFVAFNETLKLRAPGVLLGHYFDGISEMPRVSFLTLLYPQTLCDSP